MRGLRLKWVRAGEFGMLLREMKKPTISMVGAGKLGKALAMRLYKSGYKTEEIVVRGKTAGRRSEEMLARKTGARVVTLAKAALTSEVLWVAVPDGAIAECARDIARHGFKGAVALHSSGALASDELEALREQGAAVAAVHPLMSFVEGEAPSLHGVMFAIEGDRKAVKVAEAIVRSLGGIPFAMSKKNKALYHAFGAFTSPLLIAHFAAAEELGKQAGVPQERIRKAMRPIVMRTLENYFRDGAAKALSGPLVRGDVETVGKHLEALRKFELERELYKALVRVALKRLPVAERKRTKKALDRA